MTLQELAAQIQKKDPTDAPTYAEMLALIEILEYMQQKMQPTTTVAPQIGGRIKHVGPAYPRLDVNPRSHTYQGGAL